MSKALPVIYVVDASIAITGAFVAARQAACALEGHARVVLVLPRGSQIPTAALSSFWRVEYLPIVALSKHVSALLRYVPALCVSAWRLRTMMQRDGATRLQLNDFYLMHGVLLRLLGYRGQVVQWIRCDPARFAGPLARLMLALGACSANRVVAVSRYVQGLLPQSANTTLLYDAYDGPTRATRMWQPEEEKRLVYVGNYIRGKGQEMALAAFAIAAVQDATLALHFYGGDMGLAKNRAYRAELEATAETLGLAPRVQFHGEISDSFAVLEPAYAALNFSQSESFSMTVLEAAGAGVPVLATMSGGPQEIIVEGTTGQLVAHGDVAAAARQIVTLAQDMAAAQRMGLAAAAHVAAHFSAAGFRAQLLALYALGDA